MCTFREDLHVSHLAHKQRGAEGEQPLFSLSIINTESVLCNRGRACAGTTCQPAAAGRSRGVGTAEEAKLCSSSSELLCSGEKKVFFSFFFSWFRAYWVHICIFAHANPHPYSGRLSVWSHRLFPYDLPRNPVG